MLRFGCKVCLEKDARIADLKTQVEDLKRFVYMPKTSTDLPIIELEANKLLEGASDEIVTIDDEREAIEAEANAILTGNY